MHPAIYFSDFPVQTAIVQKYLSLHLDSKLKGCVCYIFASLFCKSKR